MRIISSVNRPFKKCPFCNVLENVKTFFVKISFCKQTVFEKKPCSVKKYLFVRLEIVFLAERKAFEKFLCHVGTVNIVLIIFCVTCGF